MDYSGRLGQPLNCSIAGEKYIAYLPKSLPPDPPIQLDSLYSLLDRATSALGRLDGMSLILPDASLFLYMYVRKEAVLSSQIEGTQSSLSDLLLFENQDAPGAPLGDVVEVSNYVAAMNYGLERLKNFPLSLRLIKEIHGQLMASGRGSHTQPGEFRKSQNWIGGTKPSNAHFVPPPPDKLMECLDSFEKFLHDETVKLPTLIRAAIAHVQFETIHPFVDGNGRLGRLLITFILCLDGLLKEPLLYLSLYLKSNRQLYYSHLQSVRETGDWEGWIKFFLEGVIETSNQATETAQSIVALFNSDRLKVDISGRSTTGVVKVLNYLQHHPISNTTQLKESCDISLPTVLRSLNVLQDLGIVKELTGKGRHKQFAYHEYLSLLSRGTEPIVKN